MTAVNRPSKTKRRKTNAPFVFGPVHHIHIWDKDERRKRVPMRQVFANRDIPHLGIKIGDEGGWMCEESEIDATSWIGPETRIYKSHLYGSYIPGEARVSHCEIAHSHIFGYSSLRESEIMSSTIRASVVHQSAIRESNVQADRIEQSRIIRCYVRLRDTQGHKSENIVNREYDRLILFENVPLLTFLDKHEVKVMYLDVKEGPYVKIGCTKYHVTEWIKRYKQEGQANSYDEYSQKQYLAALKYIRTWWGAYKEKWADAIREIEKTGWRTREELKLEGQNNEQHD